MSETPSPETLARALLTCRNGAPHYCPNCDNTIDADKVIAAIEQPLQQQIETLEKELTRAHDAQRELVKSETAEFDRAAKAEAALRESRARVEQLEQALEWIARRCEAYDDSGLQSWEIRLLRDISRAALSSPAEATPAEPDLALGERYWNPRDIPDAVRRDLMAAAVGNGRLSYHWLCDVYRRGRGDAQTALSR